jgi:ATP-dependent Clp protease adaptor protein ClpS
MQKWLVKSSTSDQDGNESHGHVITKPKPETRTPPFYKVILLNDDYTPMDFVIHILKKFFSKSDTEANQIMLMVHQQGAGVAGIFTFEIAETKVFLVNEYSRRHQYPLKCIMEKAD